MLKVLKGIADVNLTVMDLKRWPDEPPTVENVITVENGEPLKQKKATIIFKL